MIGGLLTRGPRRRRPPTPPHSDVVDLAQVRIERALAGRERYKYVRPRVEREGRGWRIVSPNCSRHIDPDGGEIGIAWLVPANEGELESLRAAHPGMCPSGGRAGTWLLHARDHAHDCWRLEGAGLTLAEALKRVCEDPLRIYWP